MSITSGSHALTNEGLFFRPVLCEILLNKVPPPHTHTCTRTSSHRMKCHMPCNMLTISVALSINTGNDLSSSQPTAIGFLVAGHPSSDGCQLALKHLNHLYTAT